MKRRRFQNERGAAAVEFSLVVILLLSIIFGIIEFGVLMYDKHVLTNASREGARAGVVLRIPRLPDEDIINIVNQYAKDHLITFSASNNPVTEISPEEVDRVGAGLFGTDLMVTVTYQFDYLILSIFGLEGFEIKAETRMRME